MRWATQAVGNWSGEDTLQDRRSVRRGRRQARIRKAAGLTTRDSLWAVVESRCCEVDLCLDAGADGGKGGCGVGRGRV